LRETLAGEERSIAVECGLAALWGSGQGGRRQLACSFPRPLRLRHREHIVSLLVRENADGSVEVVKDGEARRVMLPVAASVRLADRAWHVQHGAVDLVVTDASFEPAAAGATTAANELRAPFNGKVIAIKAQPGATVARGDTLLVLESMKLEHALGASRDGVIKSVHVEPGQQAATSQVLVTFEALQ
jgi:3-methylcrotonyl-CoA carboxylase alpha subunit/geranyl-CoA carboxylase alpha subunit